MPFGAVWDRYCQQMSVPTGVAWMREVQAYEERVTSKRR